MPRTGQLFGRRCELQIGNRKWTDLRVTFEVERSLLRSPNKAQIAIYNLASQTVGEINQPGAVVSLVAGYQETAEVIFRGDLQRIEVQREGPDLVSRILSRDGGIAWTRGISASLSGGDLSLSGAVQRIATAMGLLVPSTTRDALAGQRLRRAVALHGQGARTLDTLLRSAGYDWSIQSGALQVLAVGAALPERPVILSPQTGLVGSPVQAERGNGWVAQSLLQPKIAPGRAVVLQSERASGDYRVVRVVHRGDTHGAGVWSSELELR